MARYDGSTLARSTFPVVDTPAQVMTGHGVIRLLSSQEAKLIFTG